MKPSFIGIGAQKCASTWVHRVLRDHPQATVSDPKELNFFSFHYDHGFQWYENHFGGAYQCTAVGEISPSYLYDPMAPLRARHYNQNFRIIVTLRDPLERAYSNHLHELRMGHYLSDNPTFEAGLANNPMYIEQSRYATHLKRWLTCFRAEQVLVLFQEELLAAPDEHARHLYEFLGIDTSHKSSFLDKRVNESRQPRLRSLDGLFKKAGKLGRNAGMSALISRLKNTPLISGIRRANSVPLRKLAPPMLAETRRYLENELAEEVLELADLLGKNSLPWPTWEHVQGTKDTPPHAWRALAGKARA